MDSNYICATVISLDYALKNDGNYYPQKFLKKCKYIKRKVIRHINDNFLLLISLMKIRFFLTNTYIG